MQADRHGLFRAKITKIKFLIISMPLKTATAIDVLSVSGGIQRNTGKITIILLSAEMVKITPILLRAKCILVHATF